MNLDNYLNIFCIICVLFITIYSIYNQVFEQFNNDSQIIHDIVRNLNKYFPKINKLDFFEGDESFTLNKKKVYICIKDKFGKVYDSNVLTYVILHEYTHSICPEIGHTPLYKSMFANIISKAINVGVYVADGQFPEDYCK